MPVEQRGQVIAVEHGPTGLTGRSPRFSGRRQLSRGGTSRMMREYHVRICERLGVKFPGSTRHQRRDEHVRGTFRSTLMTGSTGGPHDLGMSVAIAACSSADHHSACALRPGSHRPRAPLNILPSAQGATNAMARTLREVSASLVVRDPAPDGRNPVCEHSSSPRRQLQPYSVFQLSRRTGIKAAHRSRISQAFGATPTSMGSNHRCQALVRW
jgi:hypothetical protein